MSSETLRMDGCFRDYFEDGEPSPKCKISRAHRNVPYRIYELGSHDGSGRWKGSHYGVFVKLPTSAVDRLHSLGDLPNPPGVSSVNFGPTEDEWVGFTTLEERNYNYTSDWAALPHDVRSGDGLSEGIHVFSPEILHDAVTMWISRTLSVL